MEFDEPYLEWAPYLPMTIVQEYPVLIRNVSLGTGTFCTLEQEYSVTDPIEIGLGLVHTLQE